MKFLILYLLGIMFLLPSECCAISTEARKLSDESPVIEGMRLRQAGSDLMLIELRGTKLPHPEPVSTDSAAALFFRGARFPRNTDRKEWWDEFEWEILKLEGKKSEEWHQRYDYPLVEEVKVTSGDGGITMRIIGPKPLEVKNISGMAGSDRLRITLQSPRETTPPVQPKARVISPGDPVTVTDPVTLEVRDISVRDALTMLAKLKDLNLVIDASVPHSTMTLSFKETPFREVFSYILRMNDLTYSMAGKTLVIGSAANIGKVLGQTKTRQYRAAYADPSKLSAIITGLMKLPQTPVVYERLRSIYITATPQQHDQIEALMNRIDHPGKQIMIEARLVEISDGARQEIETMIAAVYQGWIFTYGSSGLSALYTYANGTVVPNVNPTGDASIGGVPVVGGGNSLYPSYVADPTMKMLDAGFRAMESDNKGKVLASPSVVAIDGETAVIKLTQNYLYQSGTDFNRNPQFSNQETGPTLEITPILGRDGFITIKMKVKTGEIIAFRQTGVSEAPETTNREVDTQVRVRNGEIFVIGGLYYENKNNSVRRVPILGYIPLLGELFKSRVSNHTKSQMAFIAIPYILDIPTGSAEVFEMQDAGM